MNSGESVESRTFQACCCRPGPGGHLVLFFYFNKYCIRWQQSHLVTARINFRFRESILQFGPLFLLIFV